MSTSYSFDELYMCRALQLAKLSDSSTNPNPAVGAVVVANGSIIGEGNTASDGGPHAEVKAIDDALSSYPDLVAGSTIYVTLEPCSIFGRTPPCANRIVNERLKRVVVGAIDFTAGVCGKGLEILRNAGIEVTVGVLQEKCFELARFRKTYVTEDRPYITLKQAITKNGICGLETSRLHITSPMANTISHSWRAEHNAILVGVRTAIEDAPRLDVRHIVGNQPLRVLYDPHGRCPTNASLLMDELPTVWFRGNNSSENLLSACNNVKIIDAPKRKPLQHLLKELYRMRIGKLLVEGGPSTLRAFQEEQLWDEFRTWKSQISVEALPSAKPIRGIDIPTNPIQSHAVSTDTLLVSHRT